VPVADRSEPQDNFTQVILSPVDTGATGMSEGEPEIMHCYGREKPADGVSVPTLNRVIIEPFVFRGRLTIKRSLGLTYEKTHFDPFTGGCGCQGWRFLDRA